MKKFTHYIIKGVLLLLFAVIGPQLFGQNDTIIVNDTLTLYFDRSADHVYHVANNSGNPIYSRYYFGTNENYNEIAQHYDMSTPTIQDAEIVKVEILGFRMRMAVNQVRGAGPDDIAFHYYEAGIDSMPWGDAVASGVIISGGLSEDEFVFMPDNEPIEVTSDYGFLIGFETYHGDQIEDDIFVLANSYCVVAGAPNDGFGERRTKVKLPNATWEDIIEVGPSFNQDANEAQLMLDCDAYVFPYIRTTEVVFDTTTVSGIGNVSAATFIANVYPNPTADVLHVQIDNPERKDLRVSISNNLGQILQTKVIGKIETINTSFDISDVSTGMYFLMIEDGKHKVTQNFLVE